MMDFSNASDAAVTNEAGLYHLPEKTVPGLLCILPEGAIPMVSAIAPQGGNAEGSIGGSNTEAVRLRLWKD